jgi:hypothetical protein
MKMQRFVGMCTTALCLIFQSCFFRSKDESKTAGKSMSFFDVKSVTHPTFEKKANRRGSILGGGNTSDGYVIKILDKNGFSVDLKVLIFIKSVSIVYDNCISSLD